VSTQTLQTKTSWQELDELLQYSMTQLQTLRLPVFRQAKTFLRSLVAVSDRSHCTTPAQLSRLTFQQHVRLGAGAANTLSGQDSGLPCETVRNLRTTRVLTHVRIGPMPGLQNLWLDNWHCFYNHKTAITFLGSANELQRLLF